jgi:hypothetical protein
MGEKTMSSWIISRAESAINTAKEAWEEIKEKSNPTDFELYRVIARLYGGLDVCMSHLVSLRQRSVPPDYAAKLGAFLNLYPTYKRYNRVLQEMLDCRHCYTHYYERRKLGKLARIDKGETKQLLQTGLKIKEKLVREFVKF